MTDAVLDQPGRGRHPACMQRRAVIGLLLAGCALYPAWAGAEDLALQLVSAARAQVGVTTIYDPAYVVLDFPGGDVDRARGVCTDVVIRAFRDGLGIDLQRAVNRDMKAAFARYPQSWGLKRPDRNIDHRRVGNLRRLFERVGAELPLSGDRASGDFKAGDLVTVTLPGNLPHVMILSDRSGPSGHLLVLHNIGGGAQEEDQLDLFPMTGHYRLTPEALARLSALSGG